MQVPKVLTKVKQVWKWIKITCALLVLTGIAAVITYWFKAWFWPTEPLRRTEEIIEQGEPVWLKPAAPAPYFGPVKIPAAEPMVQVSTRVVEQSLTGVVSARSLTESVQELILHPDEAVVRSEVDGDGNTRIKVLTPVTSANPNSAAPLDPTGSAGGITSSNWMFVETDILIPRVRPYVKPLALYSKDGDLEMGAGLELWRLEQKPGWLPEPIYRPLEGASADLLLTTNRVGTGLALEANRWLDIGGGFTLDLQDKKLESVIYIGVQF